MICEQSPSQYSPLLDKKTYGVQSTIYYGNTKHSGYFVSGLYVESRVDPFKLLKKCAVGNSEIMHIMCGSNGGIQ